LIRYLSCTTYYLFNIGTILSCRPSVPPDSTDLCRFIRYGTATPSSTSWCNVSVASLFPNVPSGVHCDSSTMDSPCHLAPYHPKLRSWYSLTPNQSLAYTFSAGADAQMIATFVSTAVATQEPRASQEMSYVGEGFSLV
jgi:hypothetical protein